MYVRMNLWAAKLDLSPSDEGTWKHVLCKVTAERLETFEMKQHCKARAHVMKFEVLCVYNFHCERRINTLRFDHVKEGSLTFSLFGVVHLI